MLLRAGFLCLIRSPPWSFLRAREEKLSRFPERAPRDVSFGVFVVESSEEVVADAQERRKPGEGG